MLLSLPIWSIALGLFYYLPGSFGLEAQKSLGDATKLVDGFTGVGFDLTASYGIAAVSYANGTKIVITRIDGTEDYREVLARLSLPSSMHPAPPYLDPEDMIKDQPRQAKRQARKAANLPASDDVAVLSSMIRSLQTATEHHLGHSVEAATVATPHLVALYLEDIHDSFEYLDLRYLDLPVRYGLLRETSAAYAGYGFGLCSNFTDRVACKAEQQSAPSDVVMAILYTAAALTVTHSVTSSAYYLWESPERHVEDFTLGSGARHDNPKEEFYWERIRDQLMEIMVKHQHYEKPAKVLLLGESAHDEDFRRVLGGVLHELMDEEPQFYLEDAEHVAALGAAELARRAPWDPYKLMTESGPLETIDAVGSQNDRTQYPTPDDL